MTREELQELFVKALKEKLVGTMYSNGRIIEDVSVTMNEEEIDYTIFVSFREIIDIKVKTSSPKGRVSKWSTYYF